MDKYENLGMVGEGSYGVVMKCRHKETKQLVAIKRFIETEDDKMVKKIALREVRMLKQLRHENLVNLIEVFRRKKRLCLVFEFVDHTALDELERFPGGADEVLVKRIMFQVLRGIEFCHLRNILHRDVKPENILVSKRGVVKLCDFGFARNIAPPGEVYTDYVATRWYRAPELLVGDTGYGRPIDVWAIGCLFSEMLTGEALFEGNSDIDQIYLITKCFGNFISRHRDFFSHNSLFMGMRMPDVREMMPLERRYPRLSPATVDIIKWSLRLDPNDRPTCSQLLRHELFTKGSWSDRFSTELCGKIEKEFDSNPLLKTLGVVIHGSLHEERNKAATEQASLATPLMPLHARRHMQAAMEADGCAGGSEGRVLEAENTIAKKEKRKKKTKKKEYLPPHREKPPATEKLKDAKHLSPILHGLPSTTRLADPAHTSSRISLTGSVSRLAPLPSRPPLLPCPSITMQGQPMNGPSPNHIVKQLLAPTTPPPTTHSVPQFNLTYKPKSPPSQSPPSQAAPHVHTHTLNHAPRNVSLLKHNLHQNMKTPSTSTYTRKSLLGAELIGSMTSLSRQQNALRTEIMSDTCLASDKNSRLGPNKLSPMYGDALPVTSPIKRHYGLTSPHKSPKPTSRQPLGVGGVPHIKPYSKNRDNILLPHLKDADQQHMKVSSQTTSVRVGVAGVLPIASGSQSNVLGVGLGVGAVGGMGCRGLVLGTINPSHLTSLDGHRSNAPPALLPPPTPPPPPSHSHHNTSHHIMR